MRKIFTVRENAVLSIKSVKTCLRDGGTLL